jgi:drug/metabolite transporter (DMT)-like permease
MLNGAHCAAQYTTNDAENNPTALSQHTDAPDATENDVEIPDSSCPPPLASAEQVGQRSNNSVGMLLVFLSTLCFSIGNTFVNMIGRRIPALQITLLRASTQTILSLLLIAFTAGPRRRVTATWIGARENWIKLFARGFLGILALVTLFASLQVAPASAYTVSDCR